MMIDTTNHRRIMSVCVLCLVLTVVLTGCEPLRKKFIRQKKKDKEKTGDFIPVLEPEVYPVKQTGRLEQYAQQFSLFNVWISDFADNFQTMSNEKRMINDLEAALKAVGEMQKLVTGPTVEALAKVKAQVEYLRGEYDQPEAFRNTSRMSSEVRSVERALRREFKPEIVKEFLIAE